MPSSTGQRKVQNNAMKAYRKQRQYIYRHCQLCHVTTSYALIVGVCIIMLPMLELATERVQLKTMYCTNSIKHVHPCPVTFSHTHLLPFPNNVLPAMVLQNRVAWSNIKCPSSHSRVWHVSLNLVPTGLGRRVVGVVVLLLLLMSGDIEMNPGPVGQGDLKSLDCELHPVCDKWFSLGVQLQVPIETLRCIETEHNQMNRRLLEMLTVWLKCTNPPPTWNILTEALESPPVGERLLAQQLRDKYCPQTEGGVTQGSSTQQPSPSVALPASNITHPRVSEQMVPTQQPGVVHIHDSSSPHSSPIIGDSTPPRTSPSPQPLTATTPPHPPTPGPTGPARPHAVEVAAASVHPSHSQPSQVTPTSSSPLLPSVPAQPTTYQLPTAFSQYPSSSSFNITPQGTSPIPPSATVTTPPDLPPPVPTNALEMPAVTQPATTTTAPQHPAHEHTALLGRQSIKQHVKQLQDRFGYLVYDTYEELVDKRISVHNVHAWLTTLDVFRQREHQEFIKDHLTNIEKGTHLSNLWARLGIYWNFLNFDLLEHLVSKFGSEDLKKKMESYKFDLQSFRKATRICDFINCWPERVEPPPECELREFVAKVGYCWENCTLEDLDMLEGVITRKFFLPKFVLRLREIKPGSITVTWLIPVSFVIGLQKTIESTNIEFFMEHKIESITTAGHECYPSLKTNKHSGYLQELSLSKPTVSITAPTPLHSVKPHTELTPWLPTHLHYIKPTSTSSLDSAYSSRSSRTGYSSRSSSSGYSSESSSSGYSGGSSSTGYSGRSSSSGYSSRSSSSGYSSRSSSSGYSSRSSSTGYSSRSLSTGYSSWYNELGPPPSTPAERYAREKCVDKISEHVKLLPSFEQYMSKVEIEANSSLPTKYKDYLSSTPPIRAALYTTFNAKMAAEVFTWSQHTESPPPTTMTELFTAFTLKTLVDHLSTHPVYHKLQLKVTTFSDLPTDVYKQFQGLCRMAYEGILNRQQLVFSAAHLPTGFAPIGLMQEVPQLYTEGTASSYHFIHLTLQEYLAAVHISQFSAHEQTRLFQKHVNSGHFKLTMRFLAGLTKLANISPNIMMDRKLNYFHFFFEAKDISMTTRTLGSDEMVVSSSYSWTPLDYYVTGHAISHSNCPWRLDFRRSSLDDDKFELFCQGCAASGGTGCMGHISYADFSGNGITSISIQSFVNIPPHILQYMRELDLHYNKLDGSACDLLAKVVPSMTRLEELWLGSNPIGSGGAVEVIKALCGSGVKQLWLLDTEIGEPDCEALCELLKASHSLQHLYIANNNLSSESVASIITGLSHNSSLTDLNISNSHFSMANVNSLASVLKDHSKCTLTKLYLQDCHISSEGAVELAAALCKNTTLKHLYMSPIGGHVEGITAVAKMLLENKTLKELHLRDCHISSEGAVELAAALCKNSILKHLNLNRNPIGVQGASSMSDMLQHNTSLEVLWLCDDSVGEEGVHQLINSLKHNQTLTDLWLPGKYKAETSDNRIDWL